MSSETKYTNSHMVGLMLETGTDYLGMRLRLAQMKKREQDAIRSGVYDPVNRANIPTHVTIIINVEIV